MSYINGSCFNSNAVQDMGEEQVDPNQEEDKDREMTRTFRLNNTFTGTSEYQVRRLWRSYFSNTVHANYGAVGEKNKS